MAIHGLLMYPYYKLLPTKHEGRLFYSPATHLVPCWEPFKGRDPHVQNRCAGGRTLDQRRIRAPPPSLTLSPSWLWTSADGCSTIQRLESGSIKAACRTGLRGPCGRVYLIRVELSLVCWPSQNTSLCVCVFVYINLCGLMYRINVAAVKCFEPDALMLQLLCVCLSMCVHVCTICISAHIQVFFSLCVAVCSCWWFCLCLCVSVCVCMCVFLVCIDL